jgi:hypothetical protein
MSGRVLETAVKGCRVGWHLLATTVDRRRFFATTES